MNDRIKKAIETSEAALDLGDVFWAVLSKWRRLLVWGLILAVLFGALGAYRAASKAHNAAYLAQAEEKYAQSLERYEAGKNGLETQIARYSDEIRQQKDFSARAAIMQLNPYQLYVCRGLYHVSAGQGSAPDPSAERAGAAASFLSAYSARLEKLDVKSALEGAGVQDYPPAIDEFDGLVAAQVDMEGSTLSYTAYGETEEQVRALSAAVQSLVGESRPEIREKIGEHSITLVSESVGLQMDEGLAQSQAEYNLRLTEAATALSAAFSELNSLSVPRLEVFGKMSVIKDAAVFTVIGFVGGVLASAALYALLFVVRGTLADPDDVRNRYDASVLGAIPSGRKAKGRLDSLISEHFGLPRGTTRETGERYVLANLKIAMAGKKKLLLVSSGDRACAEGLRERIAEALPEAEIRVGGSLCRDAEAVEGLSETDAVLLVETLQKARHGQIRRELIRLLESGRECLGFVLLEEGC